MKNMSFEMNLDANQTEFPRGKRAELNIYDDAAGFDCQYIINKSHTEDDITVIDDCTLIGVSIVEEQNND